MRCVVKTDRNVDVEQQQLFALYKSIWSYDVKICSICLHNDTLNMVLYDCTIFQSCFSTSYHTNGGKGVYTNTFSSHFLLYSLLALRLDQFLGFEKGFSSRQPITT